ncbi:uncharacterized protein LOC103572875 isoform X2 [Microplitis demolitor]|uniref:uncharacterized protein LOC103572875 isoform X2 n=1 Tax=Microplitis demolitor TaxID=69319 RepID=UPI0004CD3FDB|nr:uncharacterized protein LOC103572875 isoform X2 [Microplitis demolitor]XP_053597964.1 uncharacterized protein LOC103572875 isoform X2 [Microplitis demolitor]
MQTNEDLMISPERLSELAILISKTFTSEILATYYIPYSREGNKKALAREKLHLRYNHYRDILLQSGATKNCRGLKHKVIDNSTLVRLGRFEDLFTIDYAPQNCVEKLKFLAEYVNPWNTVEEYWKYTSIKRIQDLINNNQVTSIEYLSTYPALRDIYTGLKLLDIDFKQQYPNKSTRLTSQYNILEKKLLAYCEKKKKFSSGIRLYINSLKEANDKDEDVRNAITFQMLPFLLPNPLLLTLRDKTNWRPSKEDVLNGFFCM